MCVCGGGGGGEWGVEAILILAHTRNCKLEKRRSFSSLQFSTAILRKALPLSLML